ncbi:MAG TPA: rRNA maturation RNase YbeY [Rhizomicrobium sp.]|jgi:probable rRNA maturation factor|nr:rRNA maturation RNase YbeY [Rhizomicrobium sp.]
MTHSISVVVEEPGWRRRGVGLPLLRNAARLALVRGAHNQNAAQLTLLLTHDERLRALNAQFRGIDAPTNVLAFPAAAAKAYLGDVALALGVAEREATRAGIGLCAHALHLTVHGVLHLLGYDHVSVREARIMECLETAILHELGLASPYAPIAAE